MSHEDDPLTPGSRVHALWLLLRPMIEDRAQELGATPVELALALTIGAPTYVFAAARPSDRRFALKTASALYAETCASLARQGDE